MENQSHLFSLDKDITYLNCATKGPALKSVENAGILAVKSYSNPYKRTSDDYFIHAINLKKTFARVIDCDDYERIAIIPSASYGIANVINNIDFKEGDNIVIPDGQFPSNVYPWMAVAKEKELDLRIIEAPLTSENRGQKWNEKILEAIDEKTKALAISNVFWSDGTIFDLMQMRAKTIENNALLVVDGTQSVGALKFSVKEIKPDALVCAGYKWLLGPYSLGMAYYSDYFDDGKPLEHNWMHRKDSNKFANLVNYQDEYRPKAFRYSVGESSNFILQPMLQKSLDQILEWGVDNIQRYINSISRDAIDELCGMGVEVENESYRSGHLFGLKLTDKIDNNKFAATIIENKIHVAMRGDVVRVAPHVYNTKSDMQHLVEAVRSSLITTSITI